MPVFEFLCRDCDNRYDDLVGIMDDPMEDQQCPDCTSKDVVKLYSPFRTKVSSGGTTISLDGHLPGPPSQGGGGGGGCCGGACGAC
ncbi:MAG: zinc ribbon domain-containing protein [Gaiellales bacterium]